MNNFTTPDSNEIIYENYYAEIQAGHEPTGWIPPAFVPEPEPAREPEPAVNSNQRESKAYRDMTTAEKEELQNKMNALYKFGFFIDEMTRTFPSISHDIFEGELSFDLSILELEDFIPLVHKLGIDAGMEAGRRELQLEIISAAQANTWDESGNHIETGTKISPCGFTQDGWHLNGTRYSDDGYDIQGLDRAGRLFGESW